MSVWGIGGRGVLQDIIDILKGSGPAIPIILFCFGIAFLINVMSRLGSFRRRRKEREEERLEKLQEADMCEEVGGFPMETRTVVLELPPSQPLAKVVKCKGCGANNKVTVGEVGECRYCGSFFQ
jgi:hypothetical protein